MQRRPSSPDQSVESSGDMIGGTRKKSNRTRNGSASHAPKKRRRPSPTSVGVVKAGVSAVRLENGEIRPLREEVGVANIGDEEEDVEEEDLSEDNRSRPRKGGGTSRRQKNSRGSESNDRGISTFGSGIPPGQVGGPSKTMDKDELNHIIPESKKFPQVNYDIQDCQCMSFPTKFCLSGAPKTGIHISNVLYDRIGRK